MLKYKKRNVIDVSDWDKLVKETYGRPYNFQQQEGCKGRGTENFSVPSDESYDFENDSLEITENKYEPVKDMGVSLKGWLARDPKDNPWKDHIIANTMLSCFWERHFYPELQTLANDLYEKGLIEAGEYTIDIDW